MHRKAHLDKKSEQFQPQSRFKASKPSENNAPLERNHFSFVFFLLPFLQLQDVGWNKISAEHHLMTWSCKYSREPIRGLQDTYTRHCSRPTYLPGTSPGRKRSCVSSRNRRRRARGGGWPAPEPRSKGAGPQPGRSLSTLSGRPCFFQLRLQYAAPRGSESVQQRAASCPPRAAAAAAATDG